MGWSGAKEGRIRGDGGGEVIFYMNVFSNLLGLFSSFQSPPCVVLAVLYGFVSP
jgi:hypothetical protein